MAKDDKREELLNFLDNKVFDPILGTSPDIYGSDKLKRELEDVKQSTDSEKRRFHENYNSAREVRDNYLSDLSSSTAKRINEELDDLKLPSLPKVKDDFLRLCDRLNV